LLFDTAYFPNWLDLRRCPKVQPVLQRHWEGNDVLAIGGTDSILRIEEKLRADPPATHPEETEPKHYYRYLVGIRSYLVRLRLRILLPHITEACRKYEMCLPISLEN